MQPLEKSLRNKLERTVKDARDVAESAARAALEQLGVGESSPYTHLTDADRELRRKLRVHGRQLGDIRNATTEVQEITRLIEEVAYEHWHRMLFARFLAENNLLMFDDVAVTLEECGDLAADEGAANGWELAARCAAKMLPQIFRTDSPVFLLTLPPEYELKLESLVAELSPEVFTASDSLGWVYQFWQSKRKDEVNASEVKIGARELSAVTQLFTEPYMVAFLLDNALGAWWVGKIAGLIDGKELRPGAQQILKTAETEVELREFFSLPGVPLEYLRFVKQDDGEWRPAGGTFDGWPQTLKELKTLDPCCGSGHFLVAVFLMLVAMRMELEKLSAKDAVDAVLRENIHGLELDQRCVELAAFALALTAWRYPDAGGYRQIPDLQVACSGLSVSVAKEEWKQLALDKHNLRIALDWMYEVFKDAPVLGSLLNPAKTDAAKLVSWEELSQTLGQALKQESTEDTENTEMGIVAQGLAKAATLLADKYHFVVTNVPYLARGKQSDVLKDFCEKHYPAAKNDLATVFLDRCLELCGEGGTASVVLPQNWLFLTSYKKFREKLLVNERWNLIARLGPGAFETISGEVVKAVLITISKGNLSTKNTKGTKKDEGLFDSLSCDSCLSWTIKGLDVSEPRTAAEKAAGLITGAIKQVVQAKQLENPDARVSFEDASAVTLLSEIADYGKGSTTGDSLRFLLFFWELQCVEENHVYWLNSPSNRDLWTGRSEICTEPTDSKVLTSQLGCWLRGNSIWGRSGVAVNKMRELEPFLYSGEVFDDNICPICPKDESIIPAVWAYVESGEYHTKVRAVDQALKVTAGTLTKVPFDLDHWTKVAAEKYPNGLPKPYSDDPTQWIFHGHPAQSDNPLQVAVARLLGYRWPAELENPLSTENTESTEEKPEKKAVSSPNDSIGDPDSQTSKDWIPAQKHCGNDNLLNHIQKPFPYSRSLPDSKPFPVSSSFSVPSVSSVDKKGFELSAEAWTLVQKSQELNQYADDDGIVCIPPVRGEMKAESRIENLLAAAFGAEWSSNKKSELLAQADHAGKSMDTWLRDKFFDQHCKLFQHRPFIWHIWDGLRDGFAALVNYHKLDYKTLETLIYTYLGDWISRQKQDIANSIDGASEKLAAAEQLKKKLELILEGEAPYDIFVRWKPLDKQPIGWNPDLNDGVRLNIRPFITAGVLRFNKKPQINIAWDKDRGKDVESAPWYHLFNGDRINDHHLTLSEKRAAHKGGESC